MADSDIVCSGLTSYSAPGTVQLSWAVSDPNEGGLTYLQLRVVEVWAATSNNIAAAVKVAEGLTFAPHILFDTAPRWYWVRAKNKSGEFGDYFPVGATGGVQGQISLVVNSLGVAATINITGLDSVGLKITSDVGRGLEIIRSAGNGEVVRIQSLGGGQVFSIEQNDAGGPIFGGTLASGSGFCVLDSTGNGSSMTFNHSGGGDILDLGHSGSGACVDAFHNGAGTHGIRSSKSGGFAFYAVAGTYGPFTGAHDGLLRKGVPAEIGDVLVDLRVVSRLDITDTLTEVEPADRPAMATAIGVLTSRREIDTETRFAVERGSNNLWCDDFDKVIIAAVGEGQINVCGANGQIKAGDLLVTSSVLGKAMRQGDDIVRSYTVARAREASDLMSASDTAQIACIYLCG